MSGKSNRGNGFDGLARRMGLGIRNSGLVVRGVAGVHRVGGTVLRYHSISDDHAWALDYVQKSLVVTPELFERQVAFLTKRYRVVNIGEMAGQMRSRGGVDPGSVAITFDDGYEDNYRCAFPILRKHGATATFYITTGTVADARILWTVGLRRAIRSCDRPTVSLSFLGERSVDLSTDARREATIKMITSIGKRCKVEELEDILAEVHEETGHGPQAAPLPRRVMMNWDEIREMHGAGMTIGAHTHSHYNLPSLDTSDVAHEVVASRRAVEEELQAPVEHFAYPNGRTDRHCDARVAKVVAVAGFGSAVTSLAGPVSGRFSPYCIPRMGVAPRHGDLARLAADMQYSKFRHQDRHVVDEITRVLPARVRGFGANSSFHANSV
ncbi:MAG: polysaccharide deacetylase family protein [Candidatus Eisenbacteria bacterium]